MFQLYMKLLSCRIVWFAMNTEKRLTDKKKALAARITKILEEKGWTQRDLAREIGMKDSYVSALMKGELNLTLKTITVLEQGLGEKLIDML